MLTGKRFRLEHSTLALGNVEGFRKAVTIPTGAIIKVVCGPTGKGDRMVDVIWDGQVLTVFEVDINTRGTEITGESATP